MAQKRREDVCFTWNNKNYKLKWEKSEYRAYFQDGNSWIPMYLGSASADNLTNYIMGKGV